MRRRITPLWAGVCVWLVYAPAWALDDTGEEPAAVVDPNSAANDDERKESPWSTTKRLLSIPDLSLNPTPDTGNAPDAADDGAVNPDSQRVLEGDRGWPAGTVREQLDKDGTMVPFGKGSIFVPSMVQGLDEPPITVWVGDEKVADATTGMRIVLNPGEYFVQVGSGSVEQRFGRLIAVKEQQTTVMPVSWAGLTVHVVDAQLNSLRNAYELIRMSDREYIGVGFGADEQAGEPVSTWILQPGLYKIVRVGGTYRDRTDFATVRLIAGQHTQYLLVQNPDTGDFQGAGEARPEELFRSGRGFYASLILGGDAALNVRQSVVGFSGGNTYAFQGFLDTKLNGEVANSPVLLRLQITEGQSRLPNQFWQKTSDTAQLDALYVYKYKPWAGPYIRAKAVTNLFASQANFQDPTSILVLDAQTKQTLDSRGGVRSLKLLPSLGNTQITEGAGLNWRVFKTIFGEMTLRSGLGLQHTLNHDVLQEIKYDGTTHTYSRLASGNLFGVEGAILGVARITRYVVLNLVVDALVPFSRTTRVDLAMEGTVAIKLTQFAAVNFVANYHEGPYVEKAILECDVLLRFSLELL